MSHSNQAASQPHSSWQRWLLAALIIATLAFGGWGSWLYELQLHHDHTPDVLSVGYHTVQLLILHGVHLHDPVPWPLHVGRWLGAAAAFTAGLMAFGRFFRQEALLCWLRLPWQRGHVLVCGLGDLGLRLALDGRRQNKFVVAVEKGAIPAVEQARQAGVLVVEGDACDAAVLERAGVTHAEVLVVCCSSVSTNVAIAALARRLVAASPTRSSPLVCRLLIGDVLLRKSLAESHLLQPIEPLPSFRVNFRDLDLQDTAARQVLRQHPLDFQPIRPHDQSQVHLMVVGMNEMGQALALHAARLGQFANGAQHDCRLRITLVDAAANAIQHWRKAYPKLDEICEVVEVEADPRSPDFLNKLTAVVDSPATRPTLMTIAFCLDHAGRADDPENFRLGLELDRRMGNIPAQILIYQSTRSGLASLLTDLKKQQSTNNGNQSRLRVHPFGMWEDIFAWDVLLHESEDQIARRFHEDYSQLHPPQPNWENLPDHLQESNRQAADHIAVKLRAIGCVAGPWQLGKTYVHEFTAEEVALLSQMEHRRWCVEKWLAGWKHGEQKDAVNKLHPDLVSWDQLTDKEQHKDPEQIVAIPRVLRSQGLWIRRLSGGTSP